MVSLQSLMPVRNRPVADTRGAGRRTSPALNAEGQCLLLPCQGGQTGDVAQAVLGSPLGAARRCSRVLKSASGAADDDAPASGRACRRSFMGVSFDSPRSPPGSVMKPSSNAPDFCAAAITWATRWWVHPAVAADEVLGLGLARRGGLQPLRDLLVAHAFVVPEHAAVGEQVRHLELDRLDSI